MQLARLWQNGRNGRRSVVFEFEGTEVQLLRKDYQKGSATCNVIGLKQSLNELKDRMFNLMRVAPNVQAPTGQEERRQNYEQRESAV